jgi:diaminopimelate epimerase
VSAFYKLSGSGNDFLALPEPAAPPAAERIRAWCRRGVSLGADGLFVLRRLGGDRGVAMDYWNADGLPADLCLNGTRCAAQLAFHLGWAADRVRVETAAGSVLARRIDAARIALELPAPDEPLARTVEADGRAWSGWTVAVGVPHFVLVWPESLARAPVVEAGRALRHAAAFAPAGTNVDFVRFPDAATVEIRTYERGVEDETLSCGTGVLAGAAVGLALGRVDPPLAAPLSVRTQGGFGLAVGVERVDTPWSGGWTLGGDARLVATGVLLPDADLSPPLPAWS